jgi:hypothetical protein
MTSPNVSVSILATIGNRIVLPTAQISLPRRTARQPTHPQTAFPLLAREPDSNIQRA